MANQNGGADSFANQSNGNFELTASQIKTSTSSTPQSREAVAANVAATKSLWTSETKGKTVEDIVNASKDLVKVIVEQTRTQKEEIKERKKSLQQQIKEARDKGADTTALEAQLKELNEQEKNVVDQSKGQIRAITTTSAAVVQGLKNVAEVLNGSIKAVISNNNEYRNNINTRLQGISTISGTFYNSQDKWSRMQLDVTRKYGLSMIVNEQNLLKNIDKAVAAGIANNVEQRALLETLSDNIATTFEAFSKELSRFIRIQQRDTTTLMLGMESSLTTMLNQLFNDTSYLSDIGTSSITGSLMEAMSQMDAATATEFNFAVQKWLGSLYSLGMSSSAISQIAEALGQAYSGNVTAVGGQMQNLLAMSAARSGQSYADILKDGLENSNIDRLMQSMVEYLAEIAESPNNVVESAYGQVFGMNISDLRAATNLLSQAENVAKMSTSTNAMLGQVGSMIGTIGERLGMSGMLSNLKDNFLYSTAANLVGSGIGQVLYETITEFSGLLDTAIMSPMAAGFGIDFGGAKISDYIQAAIGGLGIISGIGTIITSLASGNAFTNLNPEQWNTWNGTGFTSVATSGGSGKALSVGGAAGDIASQEIRSATDQGLEQQGYEAEPQAPDHDTDDLFDELELLLKNLFGESRKPILVDINPDTVPIMPIDIRGVSAGAELRSAMFNPGGEPL